MTKREAEKWACDLIAADIRANIANGSFGLSELHATDPKEYAIRCEALERLSIELDRRGETNDKN